MSKKKSSFTADTAIPDGSTLDFVINGQNFKITKANFLAALGVTGTLSQVGAVTGYPVLDASTGTDYLIRNIEAGDGINVSISPENGILLSVPTVAPGVGTLEQVTNNGNTTDQGMELLLGSELTLKAADGHTRGVAAVNPANVTIINSADDFPAAVGVTRELVPTPGDNVVYIIACATIDMTADKFTITGGTVTIRGESRTGSLITTTATGNLFTVVDSNFFPERLIASNPNAQFMDFSAPVAPRAVFVPQNVIVASCTSVFTIADCFVTSLRTFTVNASSVGGMLWTGTNNKQLNISSMFGSGWAGTLIDLGTATFDLINLSPNNRWVSPVGTTILSGMANSGNINTGGLAQVYDNVFNGDGTSLVGVDTEDLQWDFTNNHFADGLNSNTIVDCDVFLTASTTAVISTISVYVPVAGANWSSDIANRFTTTAAGVVTYIGLYPINVEVQVTSTIEKVGGGADVICSKIAVNGAVVDKSISCTQNNNPTGVSSMALLRLVTGDTVAQYVGNQSSTSNIVVSQANMIITGK